MDGVADMGGELRFFGPLPEVDPDEAVFPHGWEGRAFAVTLLANRAATSSNLHAFRHALERVPEREYLATYYGRWLASAEILLTEAGVLAPGAIEARARALRGETVAEPADPQPNKPSMATAGGGNMRAIDAPRAFQVGDRVRATSVVAPGHTRLPAYVRGHVGVVSAFRPAQVLPDSAAHFIGENPQHVYGVDYDAHELWGADSESFSLTIDLFEPYLEPYLENV
jgi:nitrile hydratase subunit beta